VQPGDLVLRLTQEGRIDSASRTKVRPIPQAYSGGYDIIEVVTRSGPVKQGDVIVRFDLRDYEYQLRGAREAMEDARRRLEWVREEQRMQADATALSLERSQKSLEAAQRALQIWESHEGPKMLKSTELGLQQQQFYIDDQQEELDQLEKMYEGTHLATETKDIVLERARRQLRMAHAWRDIEVGDARITTQIHHPIRDRDVRDEVRYATQQHEHATVNAAIGLARKRMEVEGAERAVRDAEERLAKLEADRETFELAAPASGVMTAITMDVGESVGARQMVSEVLDPSRLVVRLNLTAEDLRVLEGGAAIRLAAPESPDTTVTGRISELAFIGTAAGDATHFPAVIAVESGADRLRLGMRCAASAERGLAGVLTVPVAAVKREHGQAWVTVRGASGDERREIVTGAVSGDMVQVVSGLSGGEDVVITGAATP
jgi:multidrug resistance efflux pump